MSTTGTVISNRARAMLDDDGAAGSYRFKPTDILMWINDATRLIWEKATESHYASDGSLNTYAELGALTENIILDDEYREAIAHYVAALALRRKSGEADNMARLESHVVAFKNMTGVDV